MRRLATQLLVLFGLSGACALLYQTVWLRQMRLIFGASTAASAAVLAIFMGGLGAGGAVLGRRADRSARPLYLYGALELGTAVLAALSPVLLAGVRALYLGLGGTPALGRVGGTVLRLALSAAVLGGPALLMGGTLPAGVRALYLYGPADAEEEERRRGVGRLYGVNTLGAVAGAVLATFYLLERLGGLRTLLCGCAINAGVGLAGLALARRAGTGVREEAPAARPGRVGGRQALALLACALCGFVFLLMELVFYRMLAPLLGGTSFTFGMILAVALAGIGLGGLSYAHAPARAALLPTWRGFALSCALEGAALALPYCLGDRVALWAALLRPLGGTGLGGQALVWGAITAVLVLPAAFFSGVQFPLLCALMEREARAAGQEGSHVAAHTGLAYACNTAGAIAGSLAGGFGLLPLLSAPGTWRLCVVLLCGLAGIGAVASGRGRGRGHGHDRGHAGGAVLVCAVTLLAIFAAVGPTAAWRHSGIGAGYFMLRAATPNGLRQWQEERRRALAWEADGTESSVAVSHEDGLAFIVGGKADGNARLDAPTQVMGGLIGAIIHDGGRAPVRSALVIGLGTGSSAGWLGAVPSIERVDVAELEPAILRVARESAPVNRDVLDNPRVHVRIGDAREVLLTSRREYDLVFSEPSNPYRAGISSLLTVEFYRAAAARLRQDGLFVQWLQAYGVDSRTVAMAYATLGAAFPVVETWQTVWGDLLLVGAKAPILYDAAALRARVAEEPYRGALIDVFRAIDLEGLLARFLARDELARAAARGAPELNTDDRLPMEYGFARTLGRSDLFEARELLAAARARGLDRPQVRGAVDWERVEDERISMYTASENTPEADPGMPPGRRLRAQAEEAFLNGQLGSALSLWRSQPKPPTGLIEVELLAEALADTRRDEARLYIEQLQPLLPVEAAAVRARLRARQGDLAGATAALEEAFAGYRRDPWPLTLVMKRALRLSWEIAGRDRALARRLYAALREPFAVWLIDEERRLLLVDLAGAADFSGLCAEAVGGLEPHVPWKAPFLLQRLRCYQAARPERAEAARRDFDAFLAAEPEPFAAGLPAGK